MVSWAIAFCWLATLKIATGILAFWVDPALPVATTGSPFPPIVYLVHAVVFTATAGLLLVGNRGDARASHLGAVFLVIGTSFSDAVLRPLQGPVGSAATVNILVHLPTDAFLPYFLWLFIRDFPKVISFGTPARIVEWAIRLSGIVGTILFVLNAAKLVTPNAIQNHPFTAALLKGTRTSQYWTTIFLLTVSAFVMMIWRTRSARLDERRRARLFVFGLAVGSAPLLLIVLLQGLVPAFRDLMRRPPNLQRAGFIVYPMLLTVPVTTTYSVLVNRVLDVRLIVRKALQYALARYTILVVSGLPFVLLLLYVNEHRDETVADLLTGVRPLGMIAGMVAGLLMLRGRQGILEALDRRFFREHYDSRQILARLVDQSRVAGTPEELATVLTTEIDKALHLHGIATLIADGAKARLSSPDRRVAPLSLSSKLAVLASETPEALDIDLGDLDSPLQRLPIEDREWLSDGGIHLLVPLVANDGSLLGLIALGEKRSELPYSREDRLLLAAVSASCASTLETRLKNISPLHRPSPHGGTASTVEEELEIPLEDELAMECAACHTIEPPHARVCAACGHDVNPAEVPYVLLGKFCFEKRIGAGGMAIVYRAFDLALGRTVAVKTLPKMSPVHAWRLRREARAIAAVEHPNLAVIFGAESWRGRPMLILELLPNGTLADRLASGPLQLPEALDLGIILASVLERTHAAGILHRDIKPSNIGYNADGIPKLLDFGLAHAVHDPRTAIGTEPRARTGEGSAVSTFLDRAALSASSHRYLVGTPAYLCPEAVHHAPPQPSFDLWSVVVVVCEAVLGVNPFHRQTVEHTLEAIGRGAGVDVREVWPECPDDLARFFRDALAKSPSRRPASATELRTRLLGLKTSLTPNVAAAPRPPSVRV